MKIKLLLICNLGIAGLTLASVAYSDVCGHASPSETLAYPCTTGWIGFFKQHYDMDSSDWDGGFGWDDNWTEVCDTGLPFARTLNGIEMLHYAAPVDATSTGDMSGNILRWGGNYSINNIDELDARCGDGTWAALTRNSGVDHWTQLHLDFFYNMSTPVRAATLLHEARHANGCGHNGYTGVQRCSRVKSCDEAWDNGCDDRTSMGSNGYEVLWLWWYLVEADSGHITNTLRSKAAAHANAVLDTAFDVPPCFNLHTNGVSYNTCP